MAEKTSVTVPLTAKQKDQIKRATGKSISALKVGTSGGLTAARRTAAFGITKRLVPRAMVAKVAAKTVAKRVAAKTLAKRLATKTLAKRLATKSLAKSIV
jgi:hypothetical protein